MVSWVWAQPLIVNSNDPAQGNPPDIIQVQAKQGRISKNLFSLCFGHNGGYLTLGEYDTTRHLPGTPVETFKFDRRAGQYRISMLKIKVDDQELPLTADQLNAGQGAFVDSGTTLIYGPTYIIE